MSLWHQTTGEGDQSLLLIHGWGMNSAVWQPILDALNKSYRVTCVDLPGHGDSPLMLSQDTLQSWAEAVSQLADENTIWVGWSLGGLVALQAALQKMPMKAMLMLAATPRFAQGDDWDAAMPLQTLDNFSDNLRQNVQLTLTRFLSLQVQGCDNARDLLKQLRAGFSAKPVARDEALLTGLDFLRDEDLRDQMHLLEVPCRFVLGEKDTLVPARMQQALNQIDDSIAVHTVSRAGHVPFLSHTDEFLQQLALLEQQLEPVT